MKFVVFFLVVGVLGRVLVGMIGGGSDFEDRATVTRAIDGDTVAVSIDGIGEDVRLVGVDTPESVRPGVPVECGAEQASASLHGLLPAGTIVRLKGDSHADERDRYGRLLAHVYVREGPSWREVELEQLRRGWATVYRFDGQSIDGGDRYDQAQLAARENDRGVWGLCSGDFHR
ncbi:MAG TPA: thermonuclease family protein [Solirubrobacterales bacterium]|nr:thermonuclease family protein [Solirubrobacterales bacterium]